MTSSGPPTCLPNYKRRMVLCLYLGFIRRPMTVLDIARILRFRLDTKFGYSNFMSGSRICRTTPWLRRVFVYDGGLLGLRWVYGWGYGT